MKRALVSVSDKQNLVPFVKGLVENGFEIIFDWWDEAGFR